MRKRRLNDDDTHSYWQSATDIMSGLLLVLLLIIMLFMVRILFFSANESTGETDHEYEEEFESGGENESDHTDYHEHDKEYDRQPEQSGGGGGGESEEEESEEIKPAEYEELAAAVYVRIVDSDTGSVISESGVRFNLLGDDNSPMSLKTYYPEEVVYRDFNTREDGTFFLPQKLSYGDYSLRNILGPAGYEAAADVSFTIEEDHDWDEPFVVDVPVGAEKNALNIQLVDTQGNPVRLSGDFLIYADEDIRTGDGSVRYVRNELVGTIHCDENGYGSSDLIYIGNYRIRTNFEEDYYVGDSDNVVTLYSSKSEKSREIYEIICEKTTIDLQLTDELYGSIPIIGAQYRLTNTATGQARTEKTDDSGKLSFTNLDKDTTYELVQTDTVSKYYADTAAESIYVDKNGYINGNPAADLLKTNRLIRISIDLKDSILRRPVKDAVVNLYDDSGRQVVNYSSGGEAKLIEGLAYGKYRIEIEGKGEVQALDLDVNDVAELQEFTVTVLDMDIVIFMAVSSVILLIVFVIILYLLKDRRSKTDAK